MKFVKRFLALFAVILLVGVTLLPAINVHAAATNLIANPSVETANPSNASAPQNWEQGNWGTNTTTFSYPSTGAHTGTRSAEVQMTSYTSGDAKWYFTPVAVTAGSSYIYSDYYESSVSTEVIAQYQTASGALSYQDFGSAPASTSWSQYAFNFTVPSGITEMTVFHLIESVGSLQTDDFSLTAAPAASVPSVSITTPTASASVSGTATVSASAADTNGIKSVQFELDGSALGSPVTTSPYQYSWNTTTTTNGTHSLTAIATNVNGVSTTSQPVSVVVNNSQPAGTNLIANPSFETANGSNPANWQTGGWGTNTTTFSYPSTGAHTGTRSAEVQMTSYTSGDAKWYFTPVAVTAGVTYNFSDYYKSSVATDVMAVYVAANGTTTYQDLGSAAASESAWKQYTASFTVPAGTQTMTIYHLISAVGTLQTDDFSLAASNLPSVSITTPTANASVNGTVTVAASASDSSGIKSVQFELDGKALGSAVTTSPYQYSWNTTTITNGTHSLTAIATDVNGKTATATTVSVNVNNNTGNLIPNPLVQTANPTNSKLPENWSTAGWGTNTVTYTYGGTGYGGSKSLNVKMTKYTSGDAKWVFDAIPVTQDQMYKFSEYYESNVQTEVDAVFNMSDGTTVYQIISLPASATAWTNITTEFAVPLGAQSMTIYHLIDSVGSLTTSDFSMTDYKPVGFKEPLVTLTFDDGYASTYTDTVPILQQYNMTSTQFIITDLLGQSGYLTDAQVQSISQDGEEIASHTVTHDDLTQETAAQVKTEMSQSQATLKSITGISPTDLAYPYGLYNSTVVSAAKQYYSAARGVEDGYNSVDNFNPYDLKVQNVYDTTTTAQIADWVAQAQATNTWLILVYHSVDDNPNPATDAGIYNVTTAQFSSELAAIQASGVKVETMQQALQEVTPQL